MTKPDVVWLKIERAEKHTAEALQFLMGFLDTDPYQLSIKSDPDTREAIIFMSVAKAVPLRLPIIVGDAISNLYSALDYLACELVTANGHRPDRTAFPISERVPTTAKQKARYEAQVSGMTQEVKDLIESMEPYRGADNNLWTLHKLNNINKHRTLVTVGYSVNVLGPAGKWETHALLKQGAELVRIPHGFKDQHKLSLVSAIAIHEPEADVIDHPLPTVLKGCVNEVKRVVRSLQPYR